ncbi:MAG: hypothetical protein FJ357_00090 [Thaumarchaeota archaeon]|nr:hypothetical protein [Nitrososphaerota archaeon]
MKVKSTMSEMTLDTIQVITFDLLRENSKEYFAIPIDRVREICTVESITKIPNSAPDVIGIVNLRNNIIPIINIKQKLGISDSIDDISRQQIVITEDGGNYYGLLVDIVHEVIRINPGEIQPISKNITDSNKFIIGIIKINETITTLLDPTTITQ